MVLGVCRFSGLEMGHSASFVGFCFLPDSWEGCLFLLALGRAILAGDRLPISHLISSFVLYIYTSFWYDF